MNYILSVTRTKYGKLYLKQFPPLPEIAFEDLKFYSDALLEKEKINIGDFIAENIFMIRRQVENLSKEKMVYKNKNTRFRTIYEKECENKNTLKKLSKNQLFNTYLVLKKLLENFEHYLENSKKIRGVAFL